MARQEVSISIVREKSDPELQQLIERHERELGALDRARQARGYVSADEAEARLQCTSILAVCHEEQRLRQPANAPLTRPGVYGTGDGTCSRDGFSVEIGGRIVPMLAKDQRMTSFCPRPAGEDVFTLGAYVRHSMGLTETRAIASGPALVPTYVSAEIIDLVRALTVVVEAGAGTIPLVGPSNAARISGDPTVYQHTEATTDISESAPTVVAVSLNPKVLAAAIPIPMEVAADSQNLDSVLNRAIAGAFAAKLDVLSIATILADANIPDSAVAHDPATWTGTMLAITAALAANQRLPQVHISTPANFMARASILESTAGGWLGKPPVLANMRELFTSSMTTDVAVFGDFAAGFAIAMRQDIQAEMLRFQKYTSAQHVLMVTARMDGVVLQPAQLYIQKKTP
jgi:hypothetical protein